MFNLLFNSSFWIGFGVVAVICIIIWICAKYPSAKVFVLSLFGSAFAIALVAVTVWCGINLGYYYTAKGGIFGALSGIEQTNTVTITDAEFSFENIELTQVEGDRYSARVNSSDTFKLDNDAQYMVLVNDYPCSDVEVFDTYITASYTYEFLTDEMQSILTDTLNIAFVFDNNYTYASITTYGGATAVEYWNSYFARNDFVIKLSYTEFSEDAEGLYGDAVIGDENMGDSINIVQYYIDSNTLFYSSVVEDNGTVKAPIPTKQEHRFMGWSLDGANVVNLNTYKITEDTTFYAVFEYIESGLFDDAGYVLYTWEELKDNGYITVDNGVLSGSGNNTELSGILKIDNEVTSIADDAFYNYSLLKKVELSDNVETIGSFAFSHCSSLQSVYLNKVKTLKRGCFSGCEALVSIFIPSTVEIIEAPDSFITSIMPPFSNCSSSLKIYCEDSAAKSGWGSYWNYYGVAGFSDLDTYYGYTYAEYLEAIA